MKKKIFRLIHNERPYKRYYYQPIEKKYPGRGLSFIYEIENYLKIFTKALYLPFNPKYNKQQFEGKRKSKFRMLCENLKWAFKYKEVCKYYFLYGLDIVGKNPNDYVAYTEFRVLRNILNIRQRENLHTLYTFNYLALVRDKFLFYQYCKSLGMPYPKIIALVSKGQICWSVNERMNFTNLETLKNANISAFCKEISGEAGVGAFILNIENKNVYINNKKSTIEELIDRLGMSSYIIQEKLENHPIIKKIYPYALNTLRLTSFLNDDGSVDFYDAILRLGANGSFVDNACRGGIFIGVNEHGELLDTGYREPGFSRNLVIQKTHPDTNEIFAGVKIPFWDELLYSIKEFHKFFYGLPSIGWDVAITSDGFVFTEAGEDWEIQLYQAPKGPQRELFYKYHGKALDVKLRRF